MIKGLVITPPILGRISIGRLIEKNGKRLPEKDDQFTVTTQIQSQDGWIPHPVDSKLRSNSNNGKLRSIPVRLLFNDPDLNLRADYCLFDRRTGRAICVGDGERCQRQTASGTQQMPCPSPESCDIGKGGNCKLFGRLYVLIGEDDEIGTFIFRTTSYNSIRTLAARMLYYQAVSGDKLACLPFELKLRGKSTTQSFRSAIYYVDLAIPESMSLSKAIQSAIDLHQVRVDSGYNQAALDLTALSGFTNSAIDLTENDLPGIVDEFYQEEKEPSSTLKEKLILKPSI